MDFDYLNERSKNVVSKLKKAVNSGDIVISPNDDKFYVQMTSAVDTPWLHAALAQGRLCPIYQRYYFDIFNIVHPVCMECWKVVAKPTTLRDMVRVYDWQKEKGYPAKSGYDIRPYTNGTYGSYWYTDSIHEGLDRLDEVREAFPDIQSFLKRGCTEYEMKKGPSNNWRLSPLEQQTFDILDDILLIDPNYKTDREQTSEIERDIKLRWVEFAYSIGDETYKDFTGGVEIFAPYVKYERPVE